MHALAIHKTEQTTIDLDQRRDTDRNIKIRQISLEKTLIQKNCSNTSSKTMILEIF